MRSNKVGARQSGCPPSPDPGQALRVSAKGGNARSPIRLSSDRHHVLKAWIAAILWLIVIAIESTAWLSAHNTSRILYPLLHFLFGLNPLQFEHWHFYIRKGGTRLRLRTAEFPAVPRLARNPAGCRQRALDASDGQVLPCWEPRWSPVWTSGTRASSHRARDAARRAARHLRGNLRTDAGISMDSSRSS